MIDKETILRIARESGLWVTGFPTEHVQAFAAAIIAHRAESGVVVPEPAGVVLDFDDSGNAIVDHACEGPIPSLEVNDCLYTHDQLLTYGNARAAEALERAAKVCADDESGRDNGPYFADLIRSLTP